MGTLLALRFSVYNLSDVVPHMESTKSLVDVAVLVATHVSNLRENAMQWHEGHVLLSC
jgi:hypothetical protein